MGKNKYIETPQRMWKLFEAYRKDIKDNPRVRHVFVGKDGNSDFERLERPLTIEGFKNYCYDVVGDITAYLVNRDNAYNDYSTICTRIKETIRQDQIEGGMVGQYNSSITQRLNGLSEKVENTNVNKEVPLFPDVQTDNSSQ
jgi:hypothetical protein